MIINFLIIIQEEKMNKIKFYKEENIPIEFHRARIVQKINLIPIDERLKCLTEAGNNTFQLYNKDIFLDMLTDSGVNAMSDDMQAAMMHADDSYAGSETYLRMQRKLVEIFNMEYFLPAHQGRACENILVQRFVKSEDIIPMNVRFDSIKEYIRQANATFIEMIKEDALITESDIAFKGNFDINKLEKVISSYGKERIPFVRIEAGSNLIGGQPVSLNNIKQISNICKSNDILLVLDASLLQDNLHFIHEREENYMNTSIIDITKEIASFVDIIYFSARKLGFARGGGICLRDKEIYDSLIRYIPTYEGYLTYGGMSVKEMEAITVGLAETMDENIISQGPEFIRYMVEKLSEYGIPVVTPPGGLGVHIDARKFLPHIPDNEYPAGALTAALYLCSGTRAMERGNISEDRLDDGTEQFAKMELVRIALPRRVYTLSQIKYVIDRLKWLYDNRTLIEGLMFYEEPEVMRFYFGKLSPVSDWQNILVKKYKQDFLSEI